MNQKTKKKWMKKIKKNETIIDNYIKTFEMSITKKNIVNKSNKKLIINSLNRLSNKKNSKLIIKIFKKINEDLKNNIPLYIFNKNSLFIKILIKIKLIFILYSVLFIPFFLILKNKYYFNQIVEIIIDIFFIIDFLKNFFLADEKLNKQKTLKNIFLFYLFNWFIFDLITSLPFSLIILIFKNYNLKNNWVIYYLNVLKFLRFLKFLKYLKHYIIIITFGFNLKRVYKRILSSIFLMIIFFHNASCLWIYIGYLGKNLDNWIIENNLEFSGISVIYLYSLYWSFQTVFTVGYGDIGSYNFHEKLITIIIMFIGVFFSSFFISSLTSILKSLDEDFNEKLKSKFVLKSIDKKYKISNILKRKINLFINKSYVITEVEYNFINNLNFNLKNELLYEINIKKIKNFSFFKDKSKDFISFLIPYFKFIHFNKGEYIFKENEVSHELFFIQKGKINLFKKYFEKKINITTIRDGIYFGEMELISGNCKRLFSAKAITNVLLLAISFELANKIFFQYYSKEGIKLINFSIEKKLKFYEIYNKKRLKNWNKSDYNIIKFKKFLINQIIYNKIISKNELNIFLLHNIFTQKFNYLQIRRILIILKKLLKKRKIKKKNNTFFNEMNIILNETKKNK